MKQRMLNTFIRKLKNERISIIITNISYALMKVCYIILRMFCHSDSLLIDNDMVTRARKKISEVRPKPIMKGVIENCSLNENITLSIIIPGYNVEKYIKECLDSILYQNTKYSYEVVVINDGSTDKTDEIIRSYTDKRLRYIVQKNQGLSGARNTGLNCAEGRYVMFVDSDDVMCEGSIDIMISSIIDSDADVVVGGYYTFDDKSNVRQYFVEKDEIIEKDSAKAVKNHGYAWGKIFKRELFQHVRFPVGAWYEDTIICSVIYRMCKKVVVLERVVYGYRINPEGISRTARTSLKSLDHYWVMENAIEQAQKVGLENDEVLYIIVLEHMSTFLYRRISLLPEEIIEATFIMACNLLNQIRPGNIGITGGLMQKDLEKAFRNGNYKLWKLASFLV